MTDEQKQQMNVAIAEKMGWGFVPSGDDASGKAFPESWIHEDGRELDEVPDYCGSLDACAEFRETINEEEWILYAAFLAEECGASLHSNPGLADWELIEANPLHHCRAFCRLHKIGPFKE